MSGFPLSSVRSARRAPLAKASIAIACAGLAAACATNPVTGKSELQFVSEASEIALGQESYAPARQAQGGDYRADPELGAYVSEVGARLAAESARPNLPYEFTVLNSSVPNAWALPGGKIALNRGLIAELENEAQLAAVISHEIVHAAARHGAKTLERGTLLQLGVASVGLVSGDGVLSSLVAGGASLAALGFNQKYGRDAELEADRYGMRMMQPAGYDPRAAVSLQEIFVRLSEGGSSGWLEGLFASHPPSTDRVEANRVEAERLLADTTPGSLDRKRFLERTATLQRTRAAYEDYDKGAQSLEDGDVDAALALARRALAAEPREPRFHGLLADVRAAQGRYSDALVHYDRAIERDPDYFAHYLHRGLARQKTGDDEGGQEDLELSARLLPTESAVQQLAQLAEGRGDHETAIGYYRSLASVDSERGHEAARSLARLDLAENPTRYVDLRTGLDARGFVTLEVSNRAPIAVRDIEIKVTRLDASGAVEDETSIRLRETLAARTRTLRRTNLGPLGPDELARVRMAVLGARAASSD